MDAATSGLIERQIAIAVDVLKVGADLGDSRCRHALKVLQAVPGEQSDRKRAADAIANAIIKH
jgi:hypothetical protein